MKNVIPLTQECAPSFYAQTQQRFLVVPIRTLVKEMLMSFLHKMKNCSLFYRIYNRICHLRITVVATVLVGISAQAGCSKVLTDTEVTILEKRLYFAPIQNKINDPGLRKYFEKFCKRMRIKYYFRNGVSTFANRKIFFELTESPINYFNFPKEERQAMRSLVNDRSVVIKKVVKGS